MNLSRLMRFTALFLIPALLASTLAEAKRLPRPEAMKAKIVARGEGAQVRVNLTDRTQLKGQIVNIGAESFTLSVKSAAEPRTIEYAQLAGVRKAKMSTESKVAVYVMVLAAAVVGLGMWALASVKM
jgi:hypothetical protein